MRTLETPSAHPSLARTVLHLLKHEREELFYTAVEPFRAVPQAILRLRYKLKGKRPLGYIGWHGHRNLGDEAIFSAIRSAFASAPFTLFQPTPGERLLQKLGLGGKNFFRAILLGGGTLINPLFREAVAMAHSWEAPLFVLGTGVGSSGFGQPSQVCLAGWGAPLRAARVAVRGPLSQSELAAIGVTHTEIIGDPALAFTPAAPPCFRSRKRLIVNLATRPGDSAPIRDFPIVRELASIVKRFTDEGGETVAVALGAGDRANLLEFRALYKLSAMRIESHRVSGEAFLKVVGGSIATIAVRLHAAVLSCCAGVPPLALAYRSKSDDFMASMNLGEYTVPFTADSDPALLRCRWEALKHGSVPGDTIYRRALDWKRKQTDYYREILQSVAN